MNVLVEVERGQHDDASSHELRIRSNRSSRAYSVSTGHANVHEDHIGMLSPYHRQGRVTVPRRADHCDLWIRGEQRGEAGAYELLVVDDHNGDHRG